MKWSSFRVRLSLWNTGVLAVALIAFGVAVGRGIEKDASAAIDRELLARTVPFAADQEWAIPRTMGAPLVTTPLRGPLPRELQTPIDPKRKGSVAKGWSIVRARMAAVNAEARRLVFFHRPRVLGINGKGVGRYGGDAPWDPEAYRRSLRGQTLYSTVDAFQIPIRVLSVPLSNGAEVVGVVQVAHEVTELNRLREGLERTLWILVPTALLLAAGGGLFLTDRALRPVGAVTRAAAQISLRDLSRRLPVEGNDELGEMAGTFNGMLERLESASEKREAAFQQLRRFTADVSHELRTPLTRLKGCLSLVRRDPVEPAALKMADDAVEEMHRLVLDLLYLSRSDAGELRLVLRPTLLGEVIETVIVAAFAVEGPRFEVELNPPSLRLWCDAFHLGRLLTNLLQNAVRHTPREGVVRISAAATGDWVVLKVRDTGEGIPPEHLPHLFERFYRVDPARDRASGGSGLGLAIARSIAEAHGGEITVRSQVGEGTEFCVLLAREPKSDSPLISPSLPARL